MAEVLQSVDTCLNFNHQPIWAISEEIHPTIMLPLVADWWRPWSTEVFHGSPWEANTWIQVLDDRVIGPLVKFSSLGVEKPSKTQFWTPKEKDEEIYDVALTKPGSSCWTTAARWPPEWIVKGSFSRGMELLMHKQEAHKMQNVRNCLHSAEGSTESSTEGGADFKKNFVPWLQNTNVGGLNTHIKHVQAIAKGACNLEGGQVQEESKAVARPTCRLAPDTAGREEKYFMEISWSLNDLIGWRPSLQNKAKIPSFSGGVGWLRSPLEVNRLISFQTVGCM